MDVLSSHKADERVISVAELVYLVYFAVMFGVRSIGIYEGQLVYNVSLVIGMLIFGCKVLMTRHTLFEYLWMGALLLLAFTVYGMSGEKGILLFFTMMMGVKGVDIRRVLTLGAWILGIAFPALFLLTQTGAMREICYMNDRIGLGFVLRHSLGYPYPNTMHTTYLVFSILILMLYRPRRVRDLIKVELAIFAGNIFLYIYAMSNTGFISVTLYLVLHLVFSIIKELKRPVRVLCELVFPVIALFSILGPIFIKGELFDFLDNLPSSAHASTRRLRTGT